MHDALIAALRTVHDPELHRDLVSLGMIEKAELVEGRADVTVRLTTPACPLKDKIENDVREAVLKVDGVTEVHVTFGAMVNAPKNSGLAGIKHIVLVGSGKGGVGKSSVAVNLAAALALDGAKVGLLDADVYGPSVAHMMGQADRRVTANAERQMEPIEAHGFRFISMANLSPAGQALVWRGPMLHSAVQQFLKDAAWGELDYLIVDLPPGTGDVQLSLTQTVTVTGAVMVTTPQDVALIDASRAVDMFKKAQVPILGVIENMSYFVAPDTGYTYDLFGRGGSRKLGDFPLLAEVPIDTELRSDADEGVPVVLAHGENSSALALREAARKLAGQISIQTLSGMESLPVL